MIRLKSQKPGKTIQIFSHVRSGTHVLEAFLAKNFYPNTNLYMRKVIWGHWSNRKRLWLGSKYAKLFVNHYFAQDNLKRLDAGPSIYIVRDGRSVAYSVWKTPNFINQNWRPIEFSKFLHKKLDWAGSPSKRVAPRLNIIEHWKLHVDGWKEVKHENLLIIHYEDLINSPEKTAKKISDKFGLVLPKNIISIDKPIGLKPNSAKVRDWQKVFNEKDLRFFHDIVGDNHWALDQVDEKSA